MIPLLFFKREGDRFDSLLIAGGVKIAVTCFLPSHLLLNPKKGVPPVLQAEQKGVKDNHYTVAVGELFEIEIDWGAVFVFAGKTDLENAVLSGLLKLEGMKAGEVSRNCCVN